MTNLVLTSNIFADTAALERAERIAKMFAESTLIPPHLRGKVADVFVGLAMAQALEINPLLVLQSISVINGKAGFASSFMVALANRSGRFRGPIRWRSHGKPGDADYEVTAYAFLTDDGEEVNATVSWAMAVAEEWTRNKKYRSMPEHMLMWRAAAFLCRRYCPDALLGMHGAEELEDVEAARGGSIRVVAAVEDAASAPKPRRTTKPLTIDATPTEADVALAEEVGAARASAPLLEDRPPAAEPSPEPEVTPEPGTPAAAPEPTMWTDGQAAEWSRALKGAGLDHEVVSDLCETATPPRPRPSVITEDQRHALFGWVTSPKGRERYAITKAARDEALAAARRLSRGQRHAAAQRAETGTAPAELSLLGLNRLLKAHDEIEDEIAAQAASDESESEGDVDVEFEALSAEVQP